MSLEEHHKFILDTMDRQSAIARKVVAELEAENVRLKAEIEKFKFTIEEERQISREDLSGLRKENAHLKAEVERLRDGVETMTYHASGVVTTTWVRAVEYDRLKAEVERLTKEDAKWHELCEKFADKVERLTEAGDAMQEQISKHLIYNHGLKVNNDWHYAKNGGKS